jgi:1-acyl-sn-glycerol-3-phosphate acyltransferase
MFRQHQHPLERRLAALSADEMVAALGVRTQRPMVRKVLGWPFGIASRPIGRRLAQFDLDTEASGLAPAAARALEGFGATLAARGACPLLGPVLIVSNHPGAYDALALMAACGRPDLLVIAADRTFLRALPRVSRHLLFVPDRVAERALALRRAFAHLRRGGAVLNFAAGDIEPDPDFMEIGSAPLRAWEAGTLGLVRAAARTGGGVVAVGVRGVHSALAKRLLVTRWAEKRGVTTMAPLIQVLARYTDVHVKVTFGARESAADVVAMGDDAAMLAHLRTAVLSALSGIGTGLPELDPDAAANQVDSSREDLG